MYKLLGTQHFYVNISQELETCSYTKETRSEKKDLFSILKMEKPFSFKLILCLYLYLHICML